MPPHLTQSLAQARIDDLTRAAETRRPGGNDHARRYVAIGRMLAHLPRRGCAIAARLSPA